MLKIDVCLFSLVIVSAFLDIFSTFIGINCFNLVETNPLGLWIPTLFKILLIVFDYYLLLFSFKVCSFCPFLVRSLILYQIFFWSYCAFNNFSLIFGSQMQYVPDALFILKRGGIYSE